jgi:hypothetical protein
LKLVKTEGEHNKRKSTHAQRVVLIKGNRDRDQKISEPHELLSDGSNVLQGWELQPNFGIPSTSPSAGRRDDRLEGSD